MKKLRMVWLLGFALAFGCVTVSAAWLEGEGEREKALELEPNLKHGRDVYEVCSGCHTPEGWGSKNGTYPQLAGQHREVLIKQLADVREGNRDNPTMYPFALRRSIGDAQALADVVAYIEKLPMNPDHGVGPWAKGEEQYALGERLYKDNCVRCHGETGEGAGEKFYPRIQGQHYAYMLRQFEWIRDGKRRNANPDMVEQIAGFTDEDMKAVINYVSRIPVPEGDLAESIYWKNPDFD